MSSYPAFGLLPTRFRLVLASFLHRPGLPFADVISEESIQTAFDAAGVALVQDDEDAVYTPVITLWSFLSQVLCKGELRSCVAAVARVTTLLVALERGPCSSNTGAYCRARARLPESAIHRLAVDAAEGCERQVPREWLWQGRHVHLVDGTTLSMPDTPENQEAYPQPSQQEAGLGFPIARLVVLLSLATGMVTDMAMGPYAGKETGETALLRPLLGRLARGDILLGDRYFCSYFMITLLMAGGVDFVTRIHSRRIYNFRRGRRLGHGDHIVEWMRPGKPEWMDPQTYDSMPASIQVREIEVHVNHPGFRAGSFVVVTTLLEDRRYTAADIGQLYGCRWLAELDIRAIKVTMGMDVLRCKTPAMIRKEAWTCLLAYNLIRRFMLQSAQRSGHSPRRLSFSAALQIVAATGPIVLVSSDAAASNLVEVALGNLADHEIGNRSGRVEPRAVKRRPKPHALLTKPRDQARAELLRPRST